MEFFKQLFELSDGVDLTLRVKRKNEKLTVSILPETGKDIQPLLLTGTPEQLDAEFFNSIKAPVGEVKEILANAKAFVESAKKSAEKSKPAASGKKPATKFKDTKKVPSKPEPEKKEEDIGLFDIPEDETNGQDGETETPDPETEESETEQQ